MAEATEKKAEAPASEAKPEATAPAAAPKAAETAVKAGETEPKPAPAPQKEAEAAKPAAAPKAKTAAAKAPARAANKTRKTRKAAVRKAPAAKKAAARATAPKASKEGRKTMTKQTQKAVNDGKIAADQFQAVFGDVNERTKNAVDRSAKLFEEMADLTRGNVEALVASSKIAAQGAESLSREAADYGRRSFEEASAALKGFAEVRSPADLFRLQGEFARSAFDSAVAESSKVSEQMLKLAGEVAQPITSRYAVAAERVKGLAA